MSLKLIQRYFPSISDEQYKKFSLLKELYLDWNSKINVISRKDMDSLYLKHVLHSLGIAKVMEFSPETKVLDVGTGGGFPGIPLAILFPDVSFTLNDSIGKKITVVKAIKQELQLDNVKPIHARAEHIDDTFHFVVSRAVTQMPVFLKWIKGKFSDEQFNVKPNGILYLKGGDLSDELRGIDCEILELNKYFDEQFFETKKVVYTSH